MILNALRYCKQTIQDRINNYRSKLSNEFYLNVYDLLENDMVMQLDHFEQHNGYSRLRHSLDVAYFSFCIAKWLHWDSRATARGGLLHDLFLYDWRDEDYKPVGRNHAVDHPKIALENARTVCELSKVEENIIVRHMWLVTVVPPRYKEGFIVTFVDKYCAVREFIFGFLKSRQNDGKLVTAF